MKKKKKSFFVSYCFSTPAGMVFGNSEVETNLFNWQEISNYLSNKHFPYGKVIILFWKEV